MKEKINLDEFYGIVLDFVAEHHMPSEDWENHMEMYQEIAYQLWFLYDRSNVLLPSGEEVRVLTPKILGKALNIFLDLNAKFNNTQN